MSWLARLKMQKRPDTHPTKPTKPGFVGFVGTPNGHVQKITGSATPANDLSPDLDRWVWPHSSVMNGAEIETLMARVTQFTDRGLPMVEAEAIADKLVVRDRDRDDRRLCLECKHLAGGGPWGCRNWHQAGVSTRSRDAQLPDDIVRLLQRCGGFQSHGPLTHLDKAKEKQ